VTPIRRKHDLDALVAVDAGMSQKKVREVTNLFLSRIMESLSDLEDVHLDGFGQFHLTVEKASDKRRMLNAGFPNYKNMPKERTMLVRITRKFKVHFSKSDVFNRILRSKHGPSGEREKTESNDAQGGESSRE